MDSHNRDHPLLGAFLAGELGPAEARRWDEHLLECEACWRAVREDRAGRPGLSCHERARAQLLRNEKGENASDDCRHIARHEAEAFTEEGVMSDTMTSLRDHLSVLGAALAQWADPDTAQDKAAAKRAGSTAIDAIDALLRDLYLLRGSLIQEIRQAADPAPSPTGRTRQRARRSPVQCGSNRPTLQTPSV